MIKPLFILISLAFSFLAASGADAPKTDPRYPFRTGFANENLPWYRLKPGEFPPHHSDQRIGGELVQADFIHRTGQFRMNKTGELKSFSMPSFGSIIHLGAEADLRDVPLGTYFLFFLNMDDEGAFTKLATMQDQYSMDAGHSFNYKLDEVKLAEGKLMVTKQSLPKKQPDLGKQELLFNDQTHFWKDGKAIKAADLKANDVLLFNRTAMHGDSPAVCTEVWVGEDTHKQVTAAQRKKFAEFTLFRGLPGWIDSVNGNTLAITLFSGDDHTFKDTYMEKLTVGSDFHMCVANDELRTWNPPVDGVKTTLKEIKKSPVNAYGTSGFQLVGDVADMLEGFRKGRCVRIFPSGSTRKDSFYGESLMGYGYAGLRTAELLENTAKEYPDQYPFRTDYSNSTLPWFKLEKGKVPPPNSAHIVLGELVKADAAKRSGQFRKDGTDELVDFTLTEEGATVAVTNAKPTDRGPSYFKDLPACVRYLGGDATLADVPPGTRYRFNMYQDDNGYFTRASLVSDEFSHMLLNHVTWVVESSNLKDGKVITARRMPKVTDYNGDLQQPPDIARTELRVDENTKVWKGDKQVKLADIAAGDELLVNVTAEAPGKPSRCTEIWVGPETHQLVTDAHNPVKPKAGASAKR